MNLEILPLAASGSTPPGVKEIVALVPLITYALVVIGNARMFHKAEYSWWGAIIPIYNNYLLVKTAGLSGWATLGMLIPGVNLIFIFYVGVKLAHQFGKGTIYGLIVLGLLFPIGYIILGWGSAEYQPTSTQQI